jgi:hypothetical protein
MELMTEKLVALRIRVEKGIEHRLAATRNDVGQGVLEYVGMVIVAAFVIAAVAAMIKGKDIAGAVGGAIDKVLNLGG